MSFLERCTSYKESNKGSKETQGPTLGVKAVQTISFTPSSQTTALNPTLSPEAPVALNPIKLPYSVSILMLSSFYLQFASS